MASSTDVMITPDMLDLAQVVANTASAITVPLFRTKIDVIDKDDQSPVTRADQAAEAAMRECVQRAFPTHGVFGEEGGYTPGSGPLLCTSDTRQI